MLKSLKFRFTLVKKFSDFKIRTFFITGFALRGGARHDTFIINRKAHLEQFYTGCIL